MKANKKANRDTSKPNADTYVQTAHEQAMKGDSKGAEASMNYGIKDETTASGVAAIKAMSDSIANEQDAKKRKVMAEAMRAKAEAVRAKERYSMPEDVKAAAAKATKGK